MSEKRNLVHWSILALRDCKLSLTSVRHFSPVCINAFCKFSFAHYSSIGSRFLQTVCLFLLLIIQQGTFLPVFTKVTLDTGLSARCLRSERAVFPVHSKYHRRSRFAKNGRKKSSKSFSRLTAFGIISCGNGYVKQILCYGNCICRRLCLALGGSFHLCTGRIIGFLIKCVHFTMKFIFRLCGKLHNIAIGITSHNFFSITVIKRGKRAIKIDSRPATHQGKSLKPIDDMGQGRKNFI